MTRSEQSRERRERVLAWLRIRGPAGATVMEVGNKLDTTTDSARRLIRELVARGLVRDSGQRRDGLTQGLAVFVFVKPATQETV